MWQERSNLMFAFAFAFSQCKFTLYRFNSSFISYFWYPWNPIIAWVCELKAAKKAKGAEHSDQRRKQGSIQSPFYQSTIGQII